MNRVEEWIAIDEKEVEQILSSTCGDWEFVSMEICPNGKRTTNYKIERENGTVLLRLYPVKADVSKKEMAIYHRFAGRLPVPEVYQSGTTKLGNTYIVMEYLEGASLASEMEKREACSETLFEEIGEMLAVIHQVSFEKEGALNEDLEIEAGLPPILDWYAYFLNGIPGKKLGAEWKQEIEGVIGTCEADLMRMTGEFVLTHGDFRPADLLVSGERVTGVLDWEFALSAPRYFDIGQFIREEESMSEPGKEAFYRGYQKGSNNRLPEDWEKLSRLMDLATMMSFLNRGEELTELDEAMIQRIKANTLFVKR